MTKKEYRITIIAGLGNPGDEYRGTRHNVGFEVLDILAKENEFSSFLSPKRAKFEMSEGVINEQRIVLVKPLTFMNLSGIGIREALIKLGRDNCRLILVHDDADIPLGKIKISKNRGPGGHKGVTSVIKELGTKDFTRIRVGILPEKKPLELDLFVLKKPTDTEKKILYRAMDDAVIVVKKEIEKDR